MAGYRRFTKEDWYAWSGAEKFHTDGSDPFIYEQDMNNGLIQLTIIVDAFGMSIYLSDADAIDEWSESMDNPDMSALRAEGEIRAAIKLIEKFDHASDLAYELDHPHDDLFKMLTYMGCV